MTQYQISNRTSGMDLGVYEGETELAAYQAMMADAGYTSEDEQGRPLDEVPADITVSECD